MSLLGVTLTEPIWGTGRLVDDELGHKLDDLTFTIGAVGGYLNAGMSFRGGALRVEDWIDRLGYHLEITNDALTVIWEGFINKITINTGAISVVRGPLLNIQNHVRVNYKSVTYNTNPPVGGEEQNTSYSSDAASVALYGQLEAQIDGGEGNSTEMVQLRDTVLAENAQPETSQTLTIGNTGEPAVTIEMVGYYTLLGRYYYTNSATGTVNLSTKLAAVFAASPTVTFDTTKITANTLAVRAQESGDKEAQGIVEDLLVRGDASDARYLMGVYNGRQVIYEAAPTDLFYTVELRDEEQRILQAQNRVKPWDVRPGKWMLVADFLTGKTPPANLRDDPRAIFIETMTYTSPWGLTVNGGKVGTLAQILAKKGLGGM